MDSNLNETWIKAVIVEKIYAKMKRHRRKVERNIVPKFLKNIKNNFI